MGLIGYDCLTLGVLLSCSAIVKAALLALQMMRE